MLLKNKLLVFSLLYLSSLNAQDTTLLVRDVFDFEIGDIFHYYINDEMSYSYDQYKVSRHTILDKYYSENEDTLFYLINDEGYENRIVSWDNYPNCCQVYQLKFYNRNQEIFYTFLDSSIYYHISKTYYNGWIMEDEYPPNDSIFYFEEYCGKEKLLFRFAYKSFSLYEDFIFGRNIGLVKHYSVTEECGGEGCNWDDLDLVYFSNANGVCGTPFLRQVGVSGFPVRSIRIYPNPAQDIINIRFKNSGHSYVELYNLNMKLLLCIESFETELSLDLSNFSTGLYILKINQNNKFVYKRFIKE